MLGIMQIDINLIAKVFNRVCERYVEQNGNLIETSVDCLWKIDTAEAIDFDRLADVMSVCSYEIGRQKNKIMC